MGRSVVGAGGWGYFSGGLAAYARAFPFVEVNATFYRRVGEATARRWRASVPPDFVFSVKAHQDVTHRSAVRPTPAARAAFAATARVARILRAPFLVLETPQSVRFGPEELAGLRTFAEMTPEGVRLGLEARAHPTGPLPAALARVLDAEGIFDVVDLSRSAPRVPDAVVYTRLFGKGEHNVYEFDDDELRDLDRTQGDAKTIAYAFHGVRMYKDAARFLTFRRTGSFPPVTGSVGIESLAEVLFQDARFPSTRDDLVRYQGWKVIDLSPGRRAHASTVLSKLPDVIYESVDAVCAAASRTSGGRVW